MIIDKTQVDDTHIYHIHIEIMPRIITHLQFLKDHPDIKILFGCDSKKFEKATDAGVKYAFMAIRPLMEMVGLSMDRLLLHTHVYADQVYLPMEGACQDPVYNTWSILNMRKKFLQQLGYDPFAYRSKHKQPATLSTRRILNSNSDVIDIASNNLQSLNDIRKALDVMKREKGIISISHENTITSNAKNMSMVIIENESEGKKKEAGEGKKVRKKMILLTRSKGAKHTRNSHDLVRQWSDEFSMQVTSALEREFFDYDIVVMSDRNITLMGCHHCQVAMVADADVLVGIHGAGLAHQLYMKPNGAVFEIGPYQNDGRIVLGGGPFSRLATLLAHNYAIHHPPHEEYKWIGKASSELDIYSMITHLKSFLSGIGF